MRLKTPFKFLFNSSKISTSSVHVIFLLNTRLHCDSTKIRITPFGSTKMEIQNSQNSIQICTNELSFLSWVTDARDPHVSGPRMSAALKQSMAGTRRGTDGARRRRLLRWPQGHQCVPRDESHLPMPFPQPLPSSSYDGVGNGGRRRGQVMAAVDSANVPSTQLDRLY